MIPPKRLVVSNDGQGQNDRLPQDEWAEGLVGSFLLAQGPRQLPSQPAFHQATLGWKTCLLMVCPRPSKKPLTTLSQKKRPLRMTRLRHEFLAPGFPMSNTFSAMSLCPLFS